MQFEEFSLKVFYKDWDFVSCHDIDKNDFN